MKNLSPQENDYLFLDELEQQIDELLNVKEQVIIAVTGKPGCGKSTFGKFIRKQGFGKHSALKIAVIDDDVMTKDYLFGFIRRKVKVVSSTLDNLQPFLNMLPKRKRIVFYINTFPYKRLASCDILLELECKESLRRKRLKQRVSDPEDLAQLLDAIPDIGKLQYNKKVSGCTK